MNNIQGFGVQKGVFWAMGEQLHFTRLAACYYVTNQLLWLLPLPPLPLLMGIFLLLLLLLLLLVQLGLNVLQVLLVKRECAELF